MFGDGEEVVGEDCGLGLEGGPVFFFPLLLVTVLLKGMYIYSMERLVLRREEEEYQDGRGSLWFKLAMREASEWVSWTRRWRDCSRALIWSLVGVDILYYLIWGDCVLYVF